MTATGPNRELSPREGAESPATPAIELRGVSCQFGETRVLSDISFSVEAGEIAVVIGGSGAGKTTLLRIVMGLLKPTSGEVMIDGEDIARVSPRRLQEVRVKLGMVFQYSALLDSMSILDNVTLPLREHTRLDPDEIRRRAEALLTALDLEGVGERFPAELSGGMRKRVGLARALIREPSILMYDEPTSGLDPLTARRVVEMIQQTRDRFGVTSVVISHDMMQALSMADRLLVLDRGRIVGDGAPGDVVADPGGLAARFLEASQPKGAAATASREA